MVDDETFAAVTVLTPGEIESQPAPNIGDVIAQRPGIAASTFAPGASRPIIRGLDNYRVRIQENGIGTHDVSALSEDHAVPIDPFAAERVEIIRGPAVLRYGSQAIGGVVDVSNGRIPDAMPDGGFSAVAKGGLNSVDRGSDGGFKVTTGAGNFVLYADAFRRQTQDYDTPLGRQPNSFVDSSGYSLGGSFVWRDGFAGVSYSRFSSLYGIPGEGAAEERPRIDLQQEKVQSRGEWRVRDYGIEAIRYWLGATRYGHNEVVFDTDAASDIIGTRFTNREHEARMEVQHQAFTTPLGVLRGAIGVQWGEKRLRGFGVDEPVDGLIDPAARSESVAAFLFEELQLSRDLKLQAAGRVESTRSRGTGVDLTDPVDPLTPFEARQPALGYSTNSRLASSPASPANTPNARPMSRSCTRRASTRRPAHSRSAIRTSASKRPRPLNSASSARAAHYGSTQRHSRRAMKISSSSASPASAAATPSTPAASRTNWISSYSRSVTRHSAASNSRRSWMSCQSAVACSVSRGSMIS